jgi:hypothetical protein
VRFFISFLFLFASLQLVAQLNWIITPSDSLLLEKNKINLSQIRKLESIDTNFNLIFFLKQKGFLEASLDTIQNQKTLNLGRICKEFILLDFSKKDSIRFKDFSSMENFAQNEIEKLKELGFMQAKFKFHEFVFSENQILCKINIDSGQKKYINSLKIKRSDNKVTPNFINKLIYDVSKSYFNAKNMDALETQFRNIPFIELAAPFQFEIQDSLIDIIAEIKSRKINKFNAFIGVLPNAYNQGDLQITADVLLSVQNLLNKGISLDLNWQKPQEGNQFFNLSTQIPFLLKTPFGFKADLNIEKFDTSFFRLNYSLGLNYRKSIYLSYGIYYQYQISNTIQLNKTYLNKDKLPEIIDYSYNKVGIVFNYRKLDAFLMPKKGFLFDFQGDFGTKNIILNPNISESLMSNGEKYKKLYDSIGLSNNIVYLQSKIEIYQPLSINIIFKSSMNTKVLFSKNITKNELFTFGGNSLPRGFDDHFFASSFFSTFSNEIQFFISKDLCVKFFYDHTITDKLNSLNRREIEQPIGLGTGLNILNKNSFINFNIAAGRSSTIPFSFQNTKVHFGYVSLF